VGAAWRIYYGDGSTYSDRDGSPFHAPATNVQAIANKANNDRGFLVAHSKDAFYWEGAGWNACDQMGLWDYLLEYRGPKAVLFGRSIRDAEFFAVIKRANREGLG
jgi:hypothetical protein